MVDFNFDVKEEGDFTQGVPSIKEIALLHIRKISAISCLEFTRGYWDEKPIKVGSGIAVMKTYHPDQRAVFCNSVDFLLWIVFPYGDTDFKGKFKTFSDENNPDWEARLKKSKEIFREISLMFERTNFFDSQSGRTERAGGK